jgi:polysaccharide chain length determinant protein (PEP-CTERM system associated)
VLPGKTFTPEEILGIVLRRKWLIVFPFVVGVVGSVFLAKRLPVLYRSQTLIMVIPQRIPDSIVKSTVTAKLEDRLPSISDQIMSRSRLERIINDFNLYPVERSRDVMEDVVGRMRDDIQGPTLVGKESFRLSYVNGDAKTSQKVTERLASLYIEENLRDRENQAEGTNQFLESQLADAKGRLLEYEKKLEEYQRQYSGQLPDQLQANLQAIQNAQMQLQSISESVNRARERRLLVERQLADAQTLPAAAALPETSTNTPGPQTVAQQLQAARSRLEGFKLQYTPDHPDVRAQERTVRDLEARVAEEASRPPQQNTTAPVSPAEAARQKRIRDLTADLAVIDHQIVANQAEESSLKQTISTYQSKVDAVPTRQAELMELTRDYATVQTAYNTLLLKQQDSKLAANLERRQGGETFKILDSASFPEKPYNHLLRLEVGVGGSIAGLLLGLALVGFLEYRDSSFKTEQDVLRLLSLPVLAMVPMLLPERERQAALRRKRIIGAAAAAVVILASVAALSIWRFR